MPRKIVEELGPFGGNSRIGHVAGEEDAIERLTHMGRLELSEQPLEPLIAARAEPPALQSEAVTLTDPMDIGQMCDAPARRLERSRLKGLKSARLIHRRIGKAPEQRSHAEIGCDHDRAIGKRGGRDAAPGLQFRDIAE